MKDLTLTRRATYEEYCQLPDDGKRYEILDGEIYATPSLSPKHQYVSKRLQRILEDYFEEGLGCQVFNAPLDVILSNEDVVQPDLLVVERTQISGRGIEGAPIVLVEILSPSRPAYDRLTKARRYRVLGVTHYWIVDPDARSIECFRLEGEAYRLQASASGHEELHVPGFEGLTIALAGLWLDT
ncbi:MAG: Uma2 family endonuclease [Acidobacteriota bacterium]